MKGILLIAGIGLGLLVVVVIVLLMRARAAKVTPAPVVKPWSQVRDDLFDAARSGSLGNSSASRAQVDAKLFLLPRSDHALVSACSERSDSNWRQACALLDKIFGAIQAEMDAVGGGAGAYSALIPGRRAIVNAYMLEMEVNNGGFDQYYLNSSGDGAAFAPASLELLGEKAIAALVKRANAAFPNGPPGDRTQRLSEQERLGDSAQKIWDAIDREFFESNAVLVYAQLRYVRDHPSEFFRD